MKLRMAAVWAVVGMAGSSALALEVPLERRSPVTAAPAPALAPAAPSVTSEPTQGARPRFHVERGLVFDARLGHASLSSAGEGETFLLASVAGADALRPATTPTSLAIVIDKSGSMKGPRMANALAAATGVIERMRDDDRVTVVAFDDAARVVVPSTPVTASTRPSILASVRAIRTGGDTCISCGLEAAMAELQSSRATSDEVQRAILLSDGAANRGVRDAAGLRGLGARARDRGCAITTVGLDVDFDEKGMSQLAAESNGRHVFVANASDLAQVFDGELDSVLATVARDAELVVEPAPGMEVAEVLDRAFRREGDRIVVPFGTFGPRQEKTALLRLRVAAARPGVVPVASVSLRWRDLAQRADEGERGELSLVAVGAGESPGELDPFVAARVERSRTARTLTDANRLFEEGRGDEARQRLAERTAHLHAAAARAEAIAQAAPAPRPANAPALKDDFDGQLGALSSAQSAFAAPPAPLATGAGGFAGGGPAAAPPPASREAKRAVRENQSRAFDLAF